MVLRGIGCWLGMVGKEVVGMMGEGGKGRRGEWISVWLT